MVAEDIGFGDPNDGARDTKRQFKKKKHVGSKKAGGFHAMGLSFAVMKGVKKRGYKIPTPIQRKTIPLVIEGRDVVAMARTGSGKTACFLIPLFEKLKIRKAQSGARALILSPTRELALQTLKFIKDLGRFTDLVTAVVVGGDSMDNQFSAIHGNPDIIVATPGRLMHICVEMELKLHSVEYIVFDEADRLFELGFGGQLEDIVRRLPDSRQTLLFSATLPKVLVEFAKAGLNDPVLIRLDVDTKLPDQLKLSFLCCRSEEKPAALLCLLKYLIKPKSPTVVFAATKFHVEYLSMLLQKAGISCTYIYSNLDPAARKINVAKFQTGKVSVLVVTDIAARGIDIPQLDYVINYNFPAKPKLFVHRVGRCARAGRSGVAYSLVAGDEYAYLIDLHLFLNRPLNIDQPVSSDNETDDDFPDGLIARIPDDLLREEHSELIKWHESGVDLVNMKKVCGNAYKQYIRSRPGASVESVKRMKEIIGKNFPIHPLFPSSDPENSSILNLKKGMKNYRPKATIFEISGTVRSRAFSVMKSTRQKYKDLILNYRKRKEESEKQNSVIKVEKRKLASTNEDELTDAFRNIIAPKRPKFDPERIAKKKERKSVVDEENYIPYKPSDHHTEQGFTVNNFHHEASKANLDLTADTGETLLAQRQLKRWDSKKKKLVNVDLGEVKKIKDEAGNWIPATYKTNRYAQWKERAKIDENDSDDEEDGDKGSQKKNQLKSLKTHPNTHWGRHNSKVQNKRKSELKTPDQILKARSKKQKKQKMKRKNVKPKKKTKRRK